MYLCIQTSSHITYRYIPIFHSDSHHKKYDLSSHSCSSAQFLEHLFILLHEWVKWSNLIVRKPPYPPPQQQTEYSTVVVVNASNKFTGLYVQANRWRARW